MIAEKMPMENNKPRDKGTISAFQHENDMMHVGRANHRMLVALLAVCVTFIITILVFVHGYTVREKNWLDTLSRLSYPVETAKGG